MDAYYYLNLVGRGIIAASEVYDALLYFRIRERLEINEALAKSQVELYRDDEFELDDIAAYKHSIEY